MTGRTRRHQERFWSREISWRGPGYFEVTPPRGLAGPPKVSFSPSPPRTKRSERENDTQQWYQPHATTRPVTTRRSEDVCVTMRACRSRRMSTLRMRRRSMKTRKGARSLLWRTGNPFPSSWRAFASRRCGVPKFPKHPVTTRIRPLVVRAPRAMAFPSGKTRGGASLPCPSRLEHLSF